MPEDGRRTSIKKVRDAYGMYIKYTQAIIFEWYVHLRNDTKLILQTDISKPLTRARKFPLSVLVHDKHRALSSIIFINTGA